MAKGKGMSVAQAKQAALQQRMLHNKLMAARSEGVEEGWVAGMVISLWMLRTEHQWGKKRLSAFVHDFTEFVREHIVEVDRKGNGGYNGLELTDIVEALAEEVDVRIDRDAGIFWMPAVRVEEDNNE